MVDLEVRKRRCYQLALEFVSDEWFTDADAVLVHGTVENQGRRFGHAWVEHHGMIYEPVTDYEFTPEKFTELFNPVAEHRYRRSKAWRSRGKLKTVGRGGRKREYYEVEK